MLSWNNQQSDEASGMAAILSYIKQAGGLERLREIILKEKFCKHTPKAPLAYTYI